MYHWCLRSKFEELYNKAVQVILTKLRERLSETDIRSQLPYISELSVLFIRDICLWQSIFVQFDLLVHANVT